MSRSCFPRPTGAEFTVKIPPFYPSKERVPSWIKIADLYIENHYGAEGEGNCSFFLTLWCKLHWQL